MSSHTCLLTLAVLALLPCALPAQDTTTVAPDTTLRLLPAESTLARPKPRHKPLMAFGQVIPTNIVVNRFDAWGKGEPVGVCEAGRLVPQPAAGLRVGREPVRHQHVRAPLPRGLYFNAGRANGLSYWESVLLTFMGSFTWEYFGEKYRPSLNDFFMTSFGGIALGEVFHRVGATIRNNRGHGTGRILREVAAMPWDPVGGLNRLARGEWSK